jgi:hypothetical protein
MVHQEKGLLKRHMKKWIDQRRFQWEQKRRLALIVEDYDDIITEMGNGEICTLMLY